MVWYLGGHAGICVQINVAYESLIEIFLIGDGAFSFNEFVEIVCNMGRSSERSVEDEERELRDAFKVFLKSLAQKNDFPNEPNRLAPDIR